MVSAHDFDEKGIPIMVLKPSIDTRDGADKVKSRVGLEREAVTVQPETNIYKAVNEYNHYRMANGDEAVKWILVDECQFMTSKQIDELAEIVDDMGISVKCYGLRTDFKTKLFPASQRLFELADELIEVKSLCKCGNRASINARIDDKGNVITSGGQIEVGGDDRYEAICRKCFKKRCLKDKEDA